MRYVSIPDGLPIDFLPSQSPQKQRRTFRRAFRNGLSCEVPIKEQMLPASDPSHCNITCHRPDATAQRQVHDGSLLRLTLGSMCRDGICRSQRYSLSLNFEHKSCAMFIPNPRPLSGTDRIHSKLILSYMQCSMFGGHLTMSVDGLPELHQNDHHHVTQDAPTIFRCTVLGVCKHPSM